MTKYVADLVIAKYMETTLTNEGIKRALSATTFKLSEKDNTPNYRTLKKKKIKSTITPLPSENKFKLIYSNSSQNIIT